MGDITYDKDTKEVQFIGHITSFVFYNKLFFALREHYRENERNVIPTFSFEYVEYFDALVVPNLMGIGIIISRLHKNIKVPLKIARTNSTKFLNISEFFLNVGESKLVGKEFKNIENNQLVRSLKVDKKGKNIFDFNSELLGFLDYPFYDKEVKKKEYNPEHKVHVYENDSFLYYSKFIEERTTEKELDAIRTDKYNVLKVDIFEDYKCILSNIKDEDQVKTILKILAEIITNSVLYSDSLCMAMLQSTSTDEYHNTKISISDFGVGLEYSFEKKREKFNKEYKEIFNQFSTIEQEKFKNYLFIFETLNYSKKKSRYRENLYTLLDIVVIQNDGIMRVHYDNTQVTFTSDRCKKCVTCKRADGKVEIDPIKCSRCLLKNISSDLAKSPVRIFTSKFQGVHIEVELKF